MRYVAGTGRRPIWIAALIAFAVFAAGCGGSTDNESSNGDNAKAGASGDLKLAVVLPGKIDDGSWNTDGYDGLQAAAKKLDAEAAYVENVGPANQEQALRNYGSQGFDVVYAHGGQYETAVETVAPQFPDTQFVTISGVGSGTAPNMNVYTVDFTKGFYVQGLIAGMLSESKRLGVVTALQGLANVNEGVSAFRAGAKAADPNVKTTVVYLKNNEDPAEAKAAAQSMINDGVDGLGVSALNAAQTGVIQAAADADVWLGTQYADFTADAAKQITTSQLYAWGAMYTMAAETFEAGELNGVAEKFGFVQAEGDPGTQMFYSEKDMFNPDLPADVVKAAEKAMEDLESGKIEVEVSSEAAAPGTR